jgi:hypothetical protein
MMAAIYGDAWHERTCSLTRQPADDMEAMQEEIQASSTPRHVSRIPSKAYLTAAEWKSLCLRPLLSGIV